MSWQVKRFWPAALIGRIMEPSDRLSSSRRAPMFGLGVQELLIIFVIIMVLFGAKKLPEMGKGLGRGIREFKNATNRLDDDEDEDEKVVEPKKVENKVKSNE
jgi:sec-independent protein translocase protein TatA